MSRRPLQSLEFLRLFVGGARLRVRTLLYALHCFIEGKVVQDQASMLQLSLDWDAGSRSTWTSGLGLAILVGGRSSGAVLRWLGEHTFLSLCHLGSILAFLSFCRSKLWSGLALLTIGQQRRTVSLAWVMQEAVGLGLARGEVVGWSASLRAASEAMSALLFARAYRTAHRRGHPAKVFLLPTTLAALAELLRTHLALSGD
eukprot:TRINITY_DN112135_c0_g1_i1.p1 TRINITY_DN112135_c0_g1~~TRINITY_DN112135_c0_g1_i1.p1  ORF type:complete len:215 (+),score=34.49 TRINITY_DN112135_c0_g1_i1:44-646(+)